MAEVVAASLFAVGYAAIAFEHRLFVNKAAVSLVVAVILWIFAATVLPTSTVQHSLVEAGADIFALVVFLLTAMTLVEILVHYHCFDLVERWLRRKQWTMRQVGWALAGIAFVFSAFLDNLTTTIITIQIARHLFPQMKCLAVAALIVIAANAGGAFSPIGDVTTLMLWFAGKFTASEIVLQGILPSITLALVAALFLIRYLPANTLPRERPTLSTFTPSRSDKLVIAATFGSFLLPLGAVRFGLPPYLGLLAGLGFVWILTDVAKRARPQETHLTANIKKFLQQVDIESIQFFVGILLAVAALHALGVLALATDSLLGSAPELGRTVAAFIGLGLGSAIVDNVPLTAAAITALDGISGSLWVLLALTVGTGGSVLLIGSAAGVIAAGMLPRLTFTRYVRIATLPALLGFFAAVMVWTLQHQLFF